MATQGLSRQEQCYPKEISMKIEMLPNMVAPKPVQPLSMWKVDSGAKDLKALLRLILINLSLNFNSHI